MAGIIPESAEQRRKRMLDEAEAGTTFHRHTQAHADDEAGGRFARHEGQATIVGATEITKYPQLPASSPWSGLQPGPGDEPPLGLDNPCLETPPTGDPMFPPVDTGEPATLSAVDTDTQRGSPLSSNDDGGDDADTR